MMIARRGEEKTALHIKHMLGCYLLKLVVMEIFLHNHGHVQVEIPFVIVKRRVASLLGESLECYSWKGKYGCFG